MEALVALVLATGWVLALVTGLLFLIRTTDSNAEIQSLQVTAANYAEHLKAVPYEPCATPTDYEAIPGFEPSDGTTVSVESVQYWELQAPAGGAGGWTTSCVPADDAGAQLVSLVSGADGREHRLQVVKSRR